MARTRTSPDVERHLPLKPLVFQILLALADGERHGWSLVRDVQRKSSNAAKIALNSGVIAASYPSQRSAPA